MKLLEMVTMMEIKEYQQAWSIVLDRKTGSGINVNEELAKVLHKRVTKKFKRRKSCARFTDNIWAADLAEIESFSSKSENVKYLFCVIDFFTKYAWVKLLKDKKR